MRGTLWTWFLSDQFWLWVASFLWNHMFSHTKYKKKGCAKMCCFCFIFALPFFNVLCWKTYDFKVRKRVTPKTGRTGSMCMVHLSVMLSLRFRVRRCCFPLLPIAFCWTLFEAACASTSGCLGGFARFPKCPFIRFKLPFKKPSAEGVSLRSASEAPLYPY